MLERFIKVKDSLSIYINDTNITPILPDEWKLIERCVALLSPFEQATRELSSSEALISSVIPIINILMKKLDEELNTTEEIHSKFSDLKNNTLFTVSTYLDPRYKHKFFNSVEKEVIETVLLNMIMSKALSENESPKPVNPAKKSKTTISNQDQPSTSAHCRATLQRDLAMMLDSSSEDEECDVVNNNLESIIKSQLKSFCNEKKIGISEKPLVWWGYNSKKYSLICALSRRFLAPPPASVPSEQLFSGAGLIYEPTRNRLNPEKAAKLLFLKYNLPLLKFDY
jgi:hypothetical protein